MTITFRNVMLLFVIAGISHAMSFEERCGQPGVTRCFGFDSQAEIEDYIYSGASTPTVDTKVKASGTGSILFTIPSQSPANTSGGFCMNFTPGSKNYSDTNSYPIQFGEGKEFYVQWRQRFSQDYLTRRYQGAGGWKQIIIGTGDRPGEKAYSCTQLEVVVNNSYHRGFATMYHSCGVKDGQYQGLDIPTGSYDFKLQNAVEGCNYTLVKNSSSRDDYIPPCIGYKADQWMTFQVHVKIGTWYKNDKNYHEDSRIRLWVAEEGKPSKLVIDRNPDNGTGYDLVNVENIKDKYGKIWLLPYNTGKDGSEVHPVGYTWYDDLIVSTQRIPDPSASSTVINKNEKFSGFQFHNVKAQIGHAGNLDIRFELENTGKLSASLFDMQGRRAAKTQIRYFEAGKHSLSWDTPLSSGGIYALVLVTGEGLTSRHVIMAY